MADRIQIRRDSAANWTNTNPVLSQGEMGLDLDAVLFKTGDGVTAWNDLDYNPSNYPDYFPSTGPVLFDTPGGKPRKYGFTTAMTGDIVFGTAGAKESVMVKIRHNDGTEPARTAPQGVALIFEGGEYVVDIDNYIYAIAHKNDDGDVVSISYTINQHQQ